jgi:hypothetical protein
LRRHHTVSDDLPALLADNMRIGTSSVLGPNPRLARRTLVEARDSFYIVPTNGGACLASNMGAICADSTQVSTGQLVITQICADRFVPDVRIAGVLPDGARNIEAVDGAGTRRPVDVVANTYAAHGDPRNSDSIPKLITWTDASGQHQSTTPALPPDIDPKLCPGGRQ